MIPCCLVGNVGLLKYSNPARTVVARSLNERCGRPACYAYIIRFHLHTEFFRLDGQFAACSNVLHGQVTVAAAMRMKRLEYATPLLVHVKEEPRVYRGYYGSPAMSMYYVISHLSKRSFSDPLKNVILRKHRSF